AANVYSFLAEAYDYEMADYQTALDFYNLELKLRNKIEPDGDNKNLLYNMATLQNELGYYKEAETLLLDVRSRDEEEFGKNSAEFFDATRYLVELYNSTDQVDKIVSISEDLRKNVDKNSMEEAVTYKWVGDAYSIEGSYKKSERALLRGLNKFESNGLEATFEYASILNSLGILYTNMGKLPEAEEVYEQAISVIDRIQGDNEDARAGINGNLAQVYFELGNYSRAIDIQQGLIDDSKEYYGEESFQYGIDLFNLGRSRVFNKEYTTAEEILLNALEIFELSTGKDGIDYGRTLNNLSLLNTRRGYIDEAIDFGQKAIDTYIAALGKENPLTASPHYNLANAYLGYEEIEKAEPLAQKAYSIRKKALGKNHPLFAKSANQMAIIKWKKKEMKEALGYYNETFENYFNQINTYFPVLTEEEKAKFYYTNLRPAFEQYISFIQESTRGEDKERLGEIYDFQLSLKGLIMYATSKVRENILSSGDEALISKYEEWISQKEQLAKLFSTSDITLEERNKKIDSLTDISNTLEEELSKGSDVFGKNFANRKLTWRDVQKSLKPDEAAVEMVRYRVFSTDSSGVFTDEVHYAALIVRADTEDYPEMVVLRNGAQMEKKYLSNYRNAIRFKISENYSYRLFWEPISRKLEGTKKIYFAPDGVYNQISIYTLQNSKTKNYLLDEIDVALVTNTKDLVDKGPTFEPGGRSVFFGYPQYSMGTEVDTDNNADNRGVRGARGSRSGGGNRLDRGASIPRGVRGNLVRYMQSFNGLAMLPGTKKEVELIDSLYNVSDKNSEAFYLTDALEGTLKGVRSPNILHIATHGFFLELDPDDKATDSYTENPLLRSGLILAGANNFIQYGEIPKEQNGDDGILTAYEAMNMNLDQTDVVIMSACETGLGEIKNGEGVYGLQRAFQIAGADAIIMSMWTVDDNATQELMTKFYEEWLSHGDKQKAFNAAQKVIRDKYKKPYYWGAFVMIGG
ncbi:MAG: CHAT domain-containing tetratricopeptide repeat protein, partial [Bacteroidota bacterium]